MAVPDFLEAVGPDAILASGGKGRMYLSTDAGLTWRPETTHATEGLKGISTSGGVTYAVGSSGIILRKQQTATSVGAPAGAAHDPLQMEVLPTVSRGWVTFRILGKERTGYTLEIFDISGRRVRRMESRSLSGGALDLQWDGRDASGRPLSGLYLVRVRSEAGESSTAKVTVLR